MHDVMSAVRHIHASFTHSALRLQFRPHSLFPQHTITCILFSQPTLALSHSLTHPSLTHSLNPQTTPPYPSYFFLYLPYHVNQQSRYQLHPPNTPSWKLIPPNWRPGLQRKWHESPANISRTIHPLRLRKRNYWSRKTSFWVPSASWTHCNDVCAEWCI